jgi:beta-phosphoglucomutase-like phosphatase (HAD superfamily)
VYLRGHYGTVRFVLGLPVDVSACLFDLDGVLTQTAKVHASAWQDTFDAFLRRRSEQRGGEFIPFDPVEDCDEYVDGRPRYEGVRSFLASRGIELPQGRPSDPPAPDTFLADLVVSDLADLLHER